MPAFSCNCTRRVEAKRREVTANLRPWILIQNNRRLSPVHQKRQQQKTRKSHWRTANNWLLLTLVHRHPPYHPSTLPTPRHTPYAIIYTCNTLQWQTMCHMCHLMSPLFSVITLTVQYFLKCVACTAEYSVHSTQQQIEIDPTICSVYDWVR